MAKSRHIGKPVLVARFLASHSSAQARIFSRDARGSDGGGLDVSIGGSGRGGRGVGATGDGAFGAVGVGRSGRVDVVDCFDDAGFVAGIGLALAADFGARSARADFAFEIGDDGAVDVCAGTVDAKTALTKTANSRIERSRATKFMDDPRAIPEPRSTLIG